MSTRATPRHSKRPYMVAVLLGTALTLGPGTCEAGFTPSDTLQAIADMDRYCNTCWRNARIPADNWTDCTQDVFTRLLERIPTGKWSQVLRSEGEERREFVRAIDAVKKRTQRARKCSGSLHGVADQRQQRSASLKESRDTLDQAAGELLSDRQQRILQLSLEGWSVQELAEELELPPERISDDKYKAIRKLRAHFASSSSGLD